MKQAVAQASSLLQESGELWGYYQGDNLILVAQASSLLQESGEQGDKHARCLRYKELFVK